MKKTLAIVSIILAVSFVLNSGCTKSDVTLNPPIQNKDENISNTSKQVNLTADKLDAPKEVEILKITVTPIVRNDRNTENEENTFFFKRNKSKLTYKGKFLFDDLIEKDVNLNINEIANYRNGKFYEMKIDPVEGVDSKFLNLGYFYVQKDKVYKIEPTEENLKKLRISDELPADSVIVCQHEEIKDVLPKDEPGLHRYLEVTKNKREYHLFNNMISTGYYESLTWEKNKGLTMYRSGYGAGRDSIELELIEK